MPATRYTPTAHMHNRHVIDMAEHAMQCVEFIDTVTSLAHRRPSISVRREHKRKTLLLQRCKSAIRCDIAFARIAIRKIGRRMFTESTPTRESYVWAYAGVVSPEPPTPTFE